LYGVVRSQLMQRIELIEEYPSRIADMLLKGSIDVGLVPVSIIPKLNEWHIVTDYCIGANGDVASVCMFSEVPVEKIERVLLDYQSRTSVNLCKILLKHYWKISPLLENAKGNYLPCIKGTTAGVVIGDRALVQRKISPYIYDLAGAWKAMTGLPFIFAAWIANKKLSADFIQEFNEANGVGLKNLEDVIAENESEIYDLRKYYRENINYDFDAKKQEALHQFLSYKI